MTAVAWDRHSVRALTRARRRNRAAGVDVFEGFYQAYLTAFGCGIAVLLGSDAIGDQHVSAHQLADAVSHGPAIIGAGLAAVLFVALRSGGRGGPLVLPAADVRHVLLAPVPRDLALRPAGFRQLRFSAFVGAVGGAALATVAARRFPGGVPEWAPIGAGVGMAVAVLAAGCGLAMAGRRVRPWLAGLVGLGLLGWSALDIGLHHVTSPMTVLGQLALAPARFRPADLAILALPLVVAALAMQGIGGLSLEQAERRATLASQIRFALTLQDLRTVVLLRRQLTQEQARTRPWIRLSPIAAGRTLVVGRDLRGVLRWPAVRVLRVLMLAAGAGASLVGVWTGTTPLILVAALCLFLAGLEVLEPLAQDVDHPDLPTSTPMISGELRARHAVVPLLLMVVVAAVAWGVAVAVAGGGPAVPVGAAMIAPAALLATVGAAVSVVMEPSFGGTGLMPAEIAGVKMVLRAIWSPAIVVLGLTPVLVARSSHAHHLAPGAAAVSAGFLPMMVGILGLGWLRFREDVHAYFKVPETK
ncbi:MAG: hypothetical protein ACYDH6_13075 [Acidimicrobiales bacterium]